MFWFKWQRKKSKKSHEKAAGARRNSRRRLLFEALETREVMATNIVNLVLAPFGPPGVALAIDGVGGTSGNNVSISQTTTDVNQYIIQGLNGTVLELNGVGATLTPSITLNGISGPITVALGSDNTFSFLGQTNITGATPVLTTQPSVLTSNLTINNGDGDSTDNLTNVQIGGNLAVTAAGPIGNSTLTITSSTVIGTTNVNNTATSGNTNTTISGSSLEATGGGVAFTLNNGDGSNITTVNGNSQFGTGPMAAVAVVINNGDGGNSTTFTGASSVAGPGTTTVYGAVNIDNGTTLPGFVNLVSFSGANVLGPVNVANGAGGATANAQTQVIGSTLGSSLAFVGGAPTVGGPLVVTNATGGDTFSLQNSTLPWGLELVNGGNTSALGSSTQITGSMVGTAPNAQTMALPAIPGLIGLAQPVLGDSMYLGGDKGNNVVTIGANGGGAGGGDTFGGNVDLQLLGGNNSVTTQDNSVMAGLAVHAGNGNNFVLLTATTISASFNLNLGNGNNSFFVAPSATLPSQLLGSVVIKVGTGLNTTNLGPLLPPGFEVFQPTIP